MAFSASDANARYRMKTGRDLPEVEKALAAAKVDQAAIDRARDAAWERAGFTAREVVINDADLRFQAKTGRFTPAKQKVLEALGLTPGPVEFSTEPAAHNDAAERFRLKTGRDLPGAKVKTIAMMDMPCYHPCCHKGTHA